MLAVQYKTIQGTPPVTTLRAEELTAKVRDLEEENKSLKAQAGQGSGSQVENLRYAAGLLEVSGKGIIVTLDDSKQPKQNGVNPNLYIIHDEDLLRIINELRAAGAEALSVNGQRLIGTSEMRCVGPNININGKLLSPPFEIRAIGDPHSLASALNLRGGVKESLKYWGIELQINKSDKVVIPAYEGTIRHEYAHASQEEGGQS
jgi:uncharacterized protein YlxW (UPF0749 family)